MLSNDSSSGTQPATGATAGATEPVAGPAQRLEVLLQISRTIAAHTDLGELLGALSTSLREVVDYDEVKLLLYDADSGEGWIYYPGLCKQRLTSIEEFPFIDGPGFWVWNHQQPAVRTLEDFRRDFPKVYPRRCGQNLRTSCAVPLTTVRRRVGAMEFLARRENAYSPEDVRFIELVAAQVATAVENALVYARLKAGEESLARERDHLRTLLEVTNAAASQLDTRKLISAVSGQIRRLIGAEFCGLVLHVPGDDVLRWEAVQCPRTIDVIKPGRPVSMSGPVVARAFREGKACTVSRQEMDRLSERNDLMALLRHEGIRAFCALPLISRGTTIGVVVIGHFGHDAFDREGIRLLGEIADQVSMSVANTVAYREIRQLRDKLNFEKLYLEEEIKAQYNFDEIVGESARLRAVLDQVQMVADSDTSVLILGETGTGKELIARAIHGLSNRRDHTLVKVNCAAIPADLLESDLFGHERGAFTGAASQKIGRFELADRGTIFLDEVGDIPLELQPKLFRALQEHEIERVGSLRPIHVDARVISATNRNLQQMIADREFRSDLYYRLNVFPIFIPPLRERPEDIPLLVRYFVQKYARKMKRDIQTIPSDAMNTMMRLPWPGNIRELEHLIERAVIMSRGSILHIPPDALTPPSAVPAAPVFSSVARSNAASLEDMERNHILSVLRDANGVVGGPRGAAARLGLKRTTLLSKMKRLGIMREGTPAPFPSPQ